MRAAGEREAPLERLSALPVGFDTRLHLSLGHLEDVAYSRGEAGELRRCRRCFHKGNDSSKYESERAIVAHPKVGS